MHSLFDAEFSGEASTPLLRNYISKRFAWDWDRAISDGEIIFIDSNQVMSTYFFLKGFVQRNSMIFP